MSDPTLPRFNSKEQMSVVPFFFMHEGEECVKVQIAGETRFTPVFRASDMWDRDGLQEITYAERWAEQYRQFKEGASQVADGIPLDEAPFLNQSRIAELRQLKIYSVEALANLDDRSIPRLGGKGYELKAMAQDFLTKRRETGANDKIAAMQAQIAELTAMLNKPTIAEPMVATTESEIDRLKEEIKLKTGSYPRGNPGIEHLRRLVAELNESA